MVPPSSRLKKLNNLSYSFCVHPFSALFSSKVADSHFLFEFAEVNESLLPKNSSLVYVVQNYIKEHLEQEICRNTVADYIHMNPDYLDRLFKKEFGLSVSQYIKEKKIDYAKMLLRTTNLSVSEIAQRLGYINLSHFTASFKQITNMTPVNYRKKY